MMGRNPLESMNIFKEDLDIPLPAEELLEMRTTIMREKLKTDLVTMPGLMKIIESFSNKLKMAITTGAQKEFLDIVVDILGLRDKFQVLQPSDEIVKGKPHPEYI
jgi:Predicted phosphatase/phosphohexomutase